MRVRAPGRRLLGEMAVLLGAAAACAAVSNLLASPQRRLDWIRGYAAPQPGTPPVPPAAPQAGAMPAGGPFAPHPDRPWVEITSEEAHALFERGALFIDARRTADYRRGHVSGALSMPVWEADLDRRLGDLAGQGRDPNAPIVVYCTGGDCEDSHQLAERLWGVGFNAAFVYRDGFPDWEKRGWPVAAGDHR
jgi:rhodanese-related sulfurtransferase